jgi:SHS2 domain-containing protein
MPYEFVEELTMADIAFRAWGRDLEETFISAADALMSAMVEDLDSIQPHDTRIWRIEQETLDMLLFNFLQELVYYKDAEQLLLRVQQLQIAAEKPPFTLQATAVGERIDPDRHRMGVDVKAVTLHRFALTQTQHGWEATVILDI